MKFSTKTVHIGSEPNLKTGGYGDVIPPIHLSSTFARKEVDKPTAGLEYSRSGNPTRHALEKNLAALENAKYAYTYASGLAAETNVLMTLKTGDHVLAIDDLYGGTRRLFTRVFDTFGLEFTFADFQDGATLEPYIKPNTKMIWFESPTNPLFKIVDIASVTEVATQKGITTVVDNTFASPYFQNPLDLGADIVLHSLTKYIGGHSDVIGGAIMLNDPQRAERLGFLQNAVGAILSPFDSYSVLRGAKTLAVRMKQHEENAKKVVEFLGQHKKVKKIYYPGLPSHPGHDIAKKQMRGFAGMLSFELNSTLQESVDVIQSLHVPSLAESLGGVESLVEHPASMTHASVPAEERKKIGLEDGLIRLSVGIEDIDDLIEDLEQAFSRI